MIEYESTKWLSVLTRVQGTVLPKLLPRVVFAALLGVGASYAHQLHGFKIPTILHTLLGAALGLLLVFRTNASYDRFWEGRKLLGSMVNRCRDLSRQINAYLEGEDEETQKTRDELRRRITLLFALIRQYLRNERDLTAIGVPITREEQEALADVVMRPLVLSTFISAQLQKAHRQGKLSDQAFWLIDQNLTTLCDNWGGCERIRKTPVPFAYAHHIKAFLALFCYTVPFALVDSMKWGTAIATVVVAYGMFGIEEIGVEIEDPFGYDPNDHPLEAIGNRIAQDVQQVQDHRRDG